MAKSIPLCPLMTAGSEIDRVCTQERCAWYMTNVKKCSAYILAYNALQESTERQKSTK